MRVIIHHIIINSNILYHQRQARQAAQQIQTTTEAANIQPTEATAHEANADAPTK